MRRFCIGLLLTLACGLGCDGGPISDFPHNHSGNTFGPSAGGAGNGALDAGSSSVPVVTPGGGSFAGGGTATGGAAGGSVGDGTNSQTPSSPGALGGTAGGTGLIGGLGGSAGGLIGGVIGGGTGGAGGGADAGSIDAGVSLDGGGASAGDLDGGSDAGDAGDAGLLPGDAGDAGDAGGCSSDSAPRADGGCAGHYCATTADALNHSVTQGACRASDTLRLVCDGRLARGTAQCAQENALSLYLGNSVHACLHRDAQLSAVASDCLDCYVQELLCSLSNCLATCVAGFEPECGDCRRASCGAQFTGCSGLPAP